MNPIILYQQKSQDFCATSTDNIVDTLQKNYEQLLMDTPSIEQVNAWKSSILYFSKILKRVNVRDLVVLLEYKLPLEGDIIDAILVGKDSSNKLIALIIEFKGWKSMQYSTLNSQLVNCDLGDNFCSPEIQLRSYIGYLEFCSTASEQYTFKGLVVMYNLATNMKNEYFISKNEDEKFISIINNTLANGVNDAELKILTNSQYKQNFKLIDFIRNHKELILKNSFELLADHGFKFSDEQANLLDRIRESIRNKENVTYLVSGEPGSGKTLLAINLLLNCLSEGYNAVLGIMNNRLYDSLENVLNNVNGKSVKSVLKYYSTQFESNPGIVDDKYKYKHEIVIYDEAQRMNAINIKHAFERGRINIILYDETQRLNYNDRGKTTNFEKVAEEKKYNIIKIKLNGIYRISIGKKYYKWLENFLINPVNFNNTKDWLDKYDFRVFNSISALMNQLSSKTKTDNVALLASFTENSTGYRIENKAAIAKGIYKDIKFKVKWIKEKSENTNFFVYGDSNKLDKCASIYGCQGFEVNYTGFIWGRDLVIRNGIWKIGDSCEDIIKREKAILNEKYPTLNKPDTTFKKLFSDAKKNGDKSDIVLELLKNRIRIFLSRGIKGTYIFFEDLETKNYILDLQNNLL